MESAVKGLHAPKNLTINIKPSSKQWELWNLLQPNRCPHCGGEIEQAIVGQTRNGRNSYRPRCKKCGSMKLPQLILGGGSAGGGKGESLDSTIVTPYGLRRFGDLKIGDAVTDPMTGGIEYIEYLHPIETRDYYRVHFIDGTYAEVSDNHIWRLHITRFGNGNKKDLDDNNVVDRLWVTTHIYKWMQEKKDGQHKGANLTIPLCAPVHFSVETQTGGALPLPPYFLGCLIGNGCMSKSAEKLGIGLTTKDVEMVERISSLGYNYDRISEPKKVAPTYIYKSQKLFDIIYDLGLFGHTAYDKFIPEQYKFASIEHRKELMQGLIDTDGYVDSRGHISYCTTSKQLADDIAFVIRGLGGKATITSKIPTYTYKGEKRQGHIAYNVYIMTKCDTELAYVPRKKSLCRNEYNGGNSELCRRIVDIEYIGKKEGRCITVNNPHGLYLTNDFIVTHNSWLGSNWICSLCIRFPDVRCVVARKTIKSLKESTFNTVRSVLKDWGLQEGVHYKINNLENWLQFWNGSIIYLKELETTPADPNFERLGSTEITAAFVDEVSEISERAIEVLMSRCRWKVAEYMGYPRVLLTTNPCATWVRSRFVQDDDGNPAVLADTDAFVRFSVYDNPNDEFVKIYENNLKNIKDNATRERLLYGNWDFIDTNEAAAYWQFNGDKHLVTELREKVYDPLKPIILSFDFNVMPYMSCLAFQIDYNRKNVYVLEEILGKPEDKENNTPKFAQKIRSKYLNEQHTGGLFITGDPAGLARSTQTEEGENNYTIIENILQSGRLKTKRKLLKKQPPQMTRLEFINSVLGGYDGWECLIDMRCRRFTEDLIYQKKNPDGTKSKAKIQDPKLGVKYEKYGHLSDCFDYFLCMFLNESWNRYQSKSSGIATTVGPIYGSFLEY